ncbi:S8 family serine peptidase [Streptomyces sp. NPDC002795]|uniref:S8 family serine peptidase n=1 Tax=Streptomyces sp. NPDC002795 TaxID=3364665 RepID=UPI0036AE96FF
MSFTRALRAVSAAAAAGALLFAAAPTASADQVRDDQWALSAFSADKIWQVATGEGVTVAVIDSGFKTSHPDLKGKFLPGKDFIDGDTSIEPDPQDNDNPGHGTAMASIIAGHGHGAGGGNGVKGLAPDAKILPIRDDGGKGMFGPAIRYAVDQGADVINISQINWTSESADSKGVQEEREAVKYALDQGVPVVAGSGNDGKTGSGAQNHPAVDPGVVAVGAIDSNGQIWDGSNYGSHLMLTAPGVDIVTAGIDSDGYDGGDGTSDSTAYTSAALALLKQKFPDLAPGQLVNRLVKTAGLPASAKGTSLPDEHYGYGYIQPLAALTKDVPAGSKSGPLKIDELNAAVGKAKGGDAAAPSSSAPDAASDASDSDGISTGLIVGIAAGVLVILVIVVIVIVRSRKNNGGGPPPPGGGWGGGGHQPYPTQQPYPGSYPQQAPPAPGGSYPQAPSQPPYGQQ